MAKEWYYAFEGTSKGPFSEEQFNALVESGAVRSETLVWQEGMDDWLPLGRASNAAITPGAAPEPSYSPTSDPARADANTFVGALKDGFARYVDFRTRSTRPQFWWWALWSIIFGISASIVDTALLGRDNGPLSMIVSLVLFLPSLALAVRRLHDSGRTGWWYLLIVIPVVGWIVLIAFYCQKSDPAPNRWGPTPRR